ncbi:hypothetical protein D4A39_04515 [Alcanivorax profundi]|uniref:Uncharacterized protein n=1 Tax=Alcanivorax profundi TaxID=2338368 RepID=A0A418Y3J1_9GAMM|nr:hypothetical protein D4A39_04515 [Alcanivorax profundi]
MAAAFFLAGAFLAAAFFLAGVFFTAAFFLVAAFLAGAFFAAAFFLAGAFFGLTLRSISLARFSRSFSYWPITRARLCACLAVAFNTFTSVSRIRLRASESSTCLRASSAVLRARSS